MKKILFWFNIVMVFSYIAIGTLFYFSPVLPGLLNPYRWMLSSVLICYGIFRMYQTYTKYKTEKNENAE